MAFVHTPVLPEAVHLYQNLKPGDICVDGTLGGAGHARRTLSAIQPKGILIGIDQDHEAIDHARTELAPFGNGVRLVHDNFSHLADILAGYRIPQVNTILLDLGVSSHQITRSKRGFSFREDAPLDMRMDIRTHRTAGMIVNTLSEKELTDLFFSYGEERFSRRIARAIVRARQPGPILRSAELAAVIADAVPKKAAATTAIHPATRVYQALRIAVNRELSHLDAFMAQVPDLLVTGGRLCVISFHSLEDRIVKQRIREFEADCTCPKALPVCVCDTRPTLRSVTRKPVTATPEEVRVNPLSRSARLRVAERI